jgi:hypothetical protein
MEPLFNPKSVYTWNRRTHSFILDISLDDYTDIFDEWDFSPYRKRDIDAGFFQFLLDSSQELPLKKSLSILFHLPEKVYDESKEKNSRKGIQNYLRYQLKKQETEKRKQLTNTFWYTVFGVLFLVLGYFLQNFVKSVFLLNLLPEGLFIGGWVLFWESFSIVFFKTRDINILIRHYRRLIASDYLYRYETQEVSDGAGQIHDHY